MSQIRLMVIVAALAVSSSCFCLAQGLCDAAFANATDRVENAPFSALRRVVSVTRHPDGTSSRREATESEARDGKGRTYYKAEDHYWTTLVGNERVEKSEILVRIFDPVASTDTTWSSAQRQV